MIRGILLTLAACLIWGLIFVVPGFMEGYHPMEIALGRYFFFGLVSCFFLVKKARFSWKVWRTVLIYSLIFAVGYYPCVVLSLQLSSPAISALILGMGPITIAYYGSWRERVGSFRALALPSSLILVGLLLINGPALFVAESPAMYLWGLAACICALGTWTWYVVANARFLKQNPEVTSGDWATLTGVTTLFWVVLFMGCYQVKVDTYMEMRFLGGSAVLGVLCSWLGMFLWNRATKYLSLSLAGQLSIFETIFGLMMIYGLKQSFPPLWEVLGIAFFLLAIFISVRRESTERSIPRQMPGE